MGMAGLTDRGPCVPQAGQFMIALWLIWTRVRFIEFVVQISDDVYPVRECLPRCIE